MYVSCMYYVRVTVLRYLFYCIWNVSNNSQLIYLKRQQDIEINTTYIIFCLFLLTVLHSFFELFIKAILVIVTFLVERYFYKVRP